MEGENINSSKAFLSIEVLLGTWADNKTFQTLIDTGLSTSLMSYEAAHHLQRIQLGKIKKSAKTEWNT